MPGPPEEPKNETIEIAGLAISRSLVPHELFGEAHAITRDGLVLTHMTPLDWDRPAQIPAIAAPGALPPGTGGALLNLIAERAVAAGIRALRYAGPYPTPALYRTLLRSFHPSHDEATFTRDLLVRAATLARTEIAVDFAPSPHRRISHPHGVSEVRDGLERTTIDGITYERAGLHDEGNAREGTAHRDGLHAHVGTAHRDGLHAHVGTAHRDGLHAHVGTAHRDGLHAHVGTGHRDGLHAHVGAGHRDDRDPDVDTAPRDERDPHVGTAPDDERDTHVSTAPGDAGHNPHLASDAGAVARLVRDGDRWAAEVWFGDRPYARVALLSADGALVDGPHPIPAISSSALGQTFPPPLRAVLGELVADLVPDPLAAAAQQLFAATTIRWADLGARVARATDDGLEVHAALWERIAPLGMARVALAIAEALAPVVTTTLVRRALADPSLRPIP